MSCPTMAQAVLNQPLQAPNDTAKSPRMVIRLYKKANYPGDDTTPCFKKMQIAYDMAAEKGIIGASDHPRL